MKRLSFLLMVLALALCVNAQNSTEARKILDKTAAVINKKNGASANFTISGKYGNTSGTIAIKGNKFNARTSESIVWYDGKTQWTYVKNNQEVNVSTPNEAQQQSMNPYKFINIYKSGYTLSKKDLSDGWEIHLTATNQNRAIKEMYITIGKNYYPKEVRMRQSKGWSTIKVSNFKSANLSDATFRFNSKDYPNAEVVDLR
ncbi:MAG: LolA-like putative outer membrane lipoprotein chaperone [Prevotellaceae bacterium]|nr:LolA-like putative outer membrane lipoprotein chaperone [Prevotellaceae bacterium]